MKMSCVCVRERERERERERRGGGRRNMYSATEERIWKADDNLEKNVPKLFIKNKTFFFISTLVSAFWEGASKSSSEKASICTQHTTTVEVA